MGPNYHVDFMLEESLIRYREGFRTVDMRAEWREGWRLNADSIRWWAQKETREAVSAPDREDIIERVVAAAKVTRRIDLFVERRQPAARATPEAVAAVVRSIDEALAFISPLAREDFDAAQSIERQLRWCRGTLRGEPVEPAPGPLTMAFRAAREFDHFGNHPEFAALVGRIQDAMKGLAPEDSDE